MAGKSPRLAGLNPASNNAFKKRVFKACERCKLKKVKCEGVSPCQRCKADDVICLFKKNSSRKHKDVPTGYVEFLETRYQLLAQGLRESHNRLVAANLLPSSNTASTEGSTSIQTILVELGIEGSDVPSCNDSATSLETNTADPATEFSALAAPRALSVDTASETTRSPSPSTAIWPTFDTSELRYRKEAVDYHPQYIDPAEFWGFSDGPCLTLDNDAEARDTMILQSASGTYEMQDPNFSSFMCWDRDGLA